MSRIVTALALAAAPILAAPLIATPAAAAATTFADGAEGWVGNGEVDPSLGLAAPAFHSVVESFGLSWRNTSNAAFVGDYTTGPSVTFSLDVLTNSIAYLGTEVTRGLFVRLDDLGPEGEEAPPIASLYFRLGTLSSAIAGWQHLTATIADTSATALPAGWGAVDGDGETQLPPGRSFADILANVDQISFTTYQPGFFYGFTDFDVAGDNFTVTRAAAAVPEPASWALMIAGFGLTGAALRRRPTRAALAA